VIHALAVVASVALAAPPAAFERACAACHGTSAAGNGPGARDLHPPPRDLTAGAFRFRTTPSGAPPRPADLERTIRRGLPGSAMPAFDGLLSDAEIAELVAYIGSLSEPPPEPIVVPTIPPATPDSIRDGHALYTLLECWKCHGERGNGHGPSAKGLVDDAGRPIRATNFRDDPLKGGRAPEDVARAILTGLNGSPMPSYADALLFPSDGGKEASPSVRDARLASLVHYILSLDKRSSFGSIVFRQKPESEPR
jgi:cytochrome c553